MKLLSTLTSIVSLASATILQSGQVRPHDYPNTTIPAISLNDSTWETYPASALELSYKGRWDRQYISWWSAPGLKFGFHGSHVAISFGNYTTDGVLVTYRLDGQDWMLTNVTANNTHLFITPSTMGYNSTESSDALRTFELRVTNWAYGVQIKSVHVSGESHKLVKIPDYPRRIEIIGDSLSAGQYATLESVMSYSWGLAYGLGETEFSITAYPGICLVDKNCWGNPHGQTLQWLKTPDTSYRALQLYGEDPAGIPDWDFSARPAADITIINLGTNDNNTANNVTHPQFRAAYTHLITQIHTLWPSTQIIVLSVWNGFHRSGSTWQQSAPGFDDIIQDVVRSFNDGGSLNEAGGEGFVHYFNTTGILQHNDVGPQWHPTDFGHVKVASHLMQYVRLVFGWELRQTGPEVQQGTLYWNDQSSY